MTKPIWKMTKAEYKATHNKHGRDLFQHKLAVALQLAQGEEPVPNEVILEYPEMWSEAARIYEKRLVAMRCK